MSPRAWLLVALLLGASAAPARADDPALAEPAAPIARQRFVEGNRLYRVRKLDEAVVAYQAGAAIEPAPIFDFNLGQCYRKLGRYSDARRHYERFLQNGRPGDELRGLVTDFVRQMRELERTEITPPRVDNAASTEADSPRARPAPPPAPDASLPIVVRDRARERWSSDGIGWTLLAGGVLGGGAAGLVLASSAGLRDDASASQDEARRAELHDRARTRRLGGIALGLGGAALIAAGAIKLAISPGPRSRPRTASSGRRIFEAVGVSRHGIVVLGRF
jgi:tetratricopeptide (TPR) repeat protein